MSERRRTAFADILRVEPNVLLENAEPSRNTPETQPPAAMLQQKKVGVARLNKATSPGYTKLTAYIPRSLAAAIKMSMVLDQTVDQSEYIEHALAEWLHSKGRETVVSKGKSLG